jgi:hypothetical protein
MKLRRKEIKQGRRRLHNAEMKLHRKEIKQVRRWFTVKKQISVGEFLTVFVILLSAAGLWFSWSKDRELRRREDAERIRQNAGTVTAKLERWAVLSSRYYSDIQPLLVDSSLKLAENHQLHPANDILWRGLFEAQARSSQRAIDEQVEIAYVSLYGYDPRIYNLFIAAVCQLKEKDQDFADQARVETESVLTQDMLQQDTSAITENLRNKCAELQASLQSEMEKIIDPFRQQMFALIRASDEDIVGRKVRIETPEKIFPDIAKGKCGTNTDAKQQ